MSVCPVYCVKRKYVQFRCHFVAVLQVTAQVYLTLQLLQSIHRSTTVFKYCLSYDAFGKQSVILR